MTLTPIILALTFIDNEDSSKLYTPKKKILSVLFLEAPGIFHQIPSICLFQLQNALLISLLKKNENGNLSNRVLLRNYTLAN